jgi:hypothetical protein
MALPKEHLTFGLGSSNRNRLADVRFHKSTCNQEFNNPVSVGMFEAWDYDGRLYAKPKADGDICWGPDDDDPGGAGGDGCEFPDETRHLRSIAILDLQDAQTVSAITEPVAAGDENECGGGGEDGSLGAALICRKEIWEIYITYDGETWTLLWYGEVEICLYE